MVKHKVPPVFDGLTTDSFLNLGMEKLTRMNEDIKKLTAVKPPLLAQVFLTCAAYDGSLPTAEG